MKRFLAFVLCVTTTVVVAANGTGRKFFDDDPILREPETQDAKGAKEREIDLSFDLVTNTFAKLGDQSNIRALNVNTIDEVPDSSWFTNRRIRDLSLTDLARGPAETEGPAVGRWTIIATKAAGMAPGFTIRDEKNDIWFIQFDTRGNREGATAANIVANRIFWALGYWQVEQHLTRFHPEDLAIAESARIRRPSGERKQLSKADVQAVLSRAAQNPDGSYRVVAARAVPGTPLGGFRYHGTRSDDPNDVVPHEHRRELRAIKVFGAWTNLVDLKAGNTLDTLITENGRSYVRHYLQDVGSTFGIGANGPHRWDEGWEHLYEGDKMMKRLVSFGFYLQPWQTDAKYEEFESVGRFEGDVFDPEQWKSRVPAAAILRARADDTFWAARRMAMFTDEAIRTVVKTGGFSDAAAEAYLANILIKRRDKITRAYLPKINPIVDPELDEAGTLSFGNAAVTAGVAPAPAGYRAQWFQFDNMTRKTTGIGSATEAAEPRLRAPAGLATVPGTFIKVELSAVKPPHESWTQPVDVYFCRMAGAWKLVGLERLP
jgi:hypothetical protein